MWSSEPRALAAARLPCQLPARIRYLRLREALDAVLGDARKEQWFQLGSALAKDQSLTEDALALVKTAFVAGQKRCNDIALLDIITGLALKDNTCCRVNRIALLLATGAQSNGGNAHQLSVHGSDISAGLGHNVAAEWRSFKLGGVKDDFVGAALSLDHLCQLCQTLAVCNLLAS